MQDQLHPRPGILQVHQQVPSLLHHARLDRGDRGEPDRFPGMAEALGGAGSG